LHRDDDNGLVAYRFESLAAEGLAHAVFTRLGGASLGPFATLNVGHTVGDGPAAVAENHARIYRHLALAADHVASAHQVHGNRIALVDAEGAGQVYPNADGLATNVPGVALFLRFADCQPILLYDPLHRALALVHAGWRGVVQAIARRAVETMQEAFDSQPGDLLAGLGPAIGPCCYTVGDDVAAAVGYALPGWKRVMHATEGGWRFDLSAANAQQLAAAGVRRIEDAGLCTSCRNDEFFSHRADHGRTGRFAVVAFLETPSANLERQEARALQAASQGNDPSTIESLDPPGLPPLWESFEDGS
jgi:YfiH family protein